jgi:hypothetical protein
MCGVLCHHRCECVQAGGRACVAAATRCTCTGLPCRPQVLRSNQLFDWFLSLHPSWWLIVVALIRECNACIFRRSVGSDVSNSKFFGAQSSTLTQTYTHITNPLPKYAYACIHAFFDSSFHHQSSHPLDRLTLENGVYVLSQPVSAPACVHETITEVWLCIHVHMFVW